MAVFQENVVASSTCTRKETLGATDKVFLQAALPSCYQTKNVKVVKKN